jgi:hypothetical protein
LICRKGGSHDHRRHISTSGTKVYDTATGMRDAEPGDWADAGDGNCVIFNNETSAVSWAKGFVTGVLVAMFAGAVVAVVIAESLQGSG